MLFSPYVTICKSAGKKSSKDCKLDHYINIAYILTKDIRGNNEKYSNYFIQFNIGNGLNVAEHTIFY